MVNDTGAEVFVESRWSATGLAERVPEVADALALMVGVWERPDGGPDRYVVCFDPTRSNPTPADTPVEGATLVAHPREVASDLVSFEENRWLFLPEGTCDWLLEVSASMPSDVTCDVDGLAPTGLIALENQILSPGADGDLCPLRAVVWKRLAERDAVMLFFCASVAGEVTPVGFSLWGHGESVDDGSGLTGDPQSHSWDRRFVSAVWHLARREDTAAPLEFSRPVRRRAARAGVTIPEVRVLHLHPDGSSRSGGTAGHGPARNHWWVQGHWRSQPYGRKRLLRRPVWIDAHLAGNRDGELLPRRRTVEVVDEPGR